MNVNNILLPELPFDQNPIYGLGDISASGLSVIVDPRAEDTADVYDTDRWLLSLQHFLSVLPLMCRFGSITNILISGTVGLEIRGWR